MTENNNICIVGGGIIGLISAFYLSQKYNVIIIEKESELCTKASNLNASTLFFSRILPLNIHGGSNSTKLFNKTYTNTFYNNYSLCKWVFWNTLYTNPFFVPNSYKNLSVNIKKSAINSFNEVCEKLKLNPNDIAISRGIYVTYDDKNKVLTNAKNYSKYFTDMIHRPHKPIQGVYLPNDYSCSSKLFSNQIYPYLIKHNVKIFTNKTINKIKLDNNSIKYLETNTGEKIYADKYVFCINECISHFFNYPILPICGLSWTFPSKKISNFNINCIVEGTHNIFYTRILDKIRVTYGYYPNPNLKYISNNYQTIIPKFPFLYKECLEKKPTICIRGVTPDGFPLIGKHKNIDNLYINSAHGFLGWTLSCYSAKLLSNIICNNEKNNLLSPNRFSFKYWLKSL